MNGLEGPLTNPEDVYQSSTERNHNNIVLREAGRMRAEGEREGSVNAYVNANMRGDGNPPQDMSEPGEDEEEDEL